MIKRAWDGLVARFPGRQRLETRQGYSDSLLALAEAHVAGTAGSGDVHLTAAAEAAAGFYGRCLAAAIVTPAGPRTAPLTAAVLDLVGRELVRRGESVWGLSIVDGTPRLEPACDWQIHGGPNPAGWTYELTMAGPDSAKTVTLGADSVIHWRTGCSPDAPWRGRSPLSRASMSSSLAGWLEARARDEVSAQVGRVIPVPDTTATGDVQTGLRTMGGKTLLVPSAATGWPDGTVGTPRSDWNPVRVGAEPPEALVALRMDAQRAVWGACGIPNALMEAGEGGGSREALRQFLHTTLGPVARQLEEEATAKLEAVVKLDFAPLYATDLTGRARAFGSLVMSGVKPPAAAAAAGFGFSDDDFQPVNAGAPPAETRDDDVFQCDVF